MLRDIAYRDRNGVEKIGRVSLTETRHSVSIVFTANEVEIRSESDNYFDALVQLRSELEPIGIVLICYGSSLNVYPSGMAKDMGKGANAYFLREGLHPTSDDIVDIFDIDRIHFVESTVKEQQDYYEKWISSKKRSQYVLPKYDVSSLSLQDGFLFFLGHQASRDGSLTKGCLSQWWPCKFESNGVAYSSAEQWMMAEKARIFRDKERLDLIMSNTDPKEAKYYGRQVSDYNDDVWSRKRYSVALNGNLLKFSQNVDLKNYLITTSPKILVEASPGDTVWGIGMGLNEKGITDPTQWKGQNLLGFALMEVRDMLK